jgi:hypothetical protein
MLINARGNQAAYGPGGRFMPADTWFSHWCHSEIYLPKFSFKTTLMLKILGLKGRMLPALFACLLFFLAASAQIKVTGKIVGGDNNAPLVAASVLVKGTKTGAFTDAAGVFTISAKVNDVLTISSVGYQNLEVKVTGASLGSISLQSANGSLEEVVVTGYSAQRKKDIAGAVSIVDVASAKRVVATSAEQLLQGLAAGVTVITTGAPGSGSNVFVRGINNFGNTTPCL